MPRLSLRTWKPALLLFKPKDSGSSSQKAKHSIKNVEVSKVPAEPDEHSEQPAKKTLLKLPNEILLLIVGLLAVEDKAILSLSCMHLRRLIGIQSDLSTADVATRNKFVRYLDPIFPDYLPCRLCGFIFDWKKRKALNYKCPCERGPFACDILPTTVYHDYPVVRIDREVADLILRAAALGMQFGLRLREANQEARYACTSDKQRTRIITRVKEEQLLFAIRCEIVQYHPTPYIRDSYFDFVRQAFCKHANQNSRMTGGWKPLGELTTILPDSEICHTFKCNHRAADFKFHVIRPLAGSLRLIMDARLNYGYRHDESLAVRQLFSGLAVERLDATDVKKRDLHTLFGPIEEKEWQAKLTSIAS